MVYSKKYSLSVEKRVYIYPLISSMSIKIDDKSGFLHVINEFVARNIYNRAGCTASCGERSHSIRCRLTQISISYSVEQSVAQLFTFCRAAILQYTVIQIVTSTFKAYINFSKVSNKILDNFSKVIETSFDCSWSIDSFRLPGLRLHCSRDSYQLNDYCIYG